MKRYPYNPTIRTDDVVSKEVLTSGYLLSMRTEHTRQTYGRVLSLLVNYLPDNLRDCRSEHLEQYIMSLKFANSTKNLHIAVIKAAFRWVSDNYYLPDPARRIKRFIALPPKRRLLTPQEFRVLCMKCSPKILPVIIFLANTGLRVTEFCSLRPENIGQHFITIVGKGVKQRKIPINSTLRVLLDSQHFINLLKNIPKNKKTVWRLCQAAAASAGIPAFHPHSLRHFFSDSLHKAKIPTSDIAKLLGHSNSAVTEAIYIHWTDEDLIGLTDCLDKKEGLPVCDTQIDCDRQAF